MCGITGIYSFRSKNSIDGNLLSKMNDSLHHRGPDEGGIHIESGVGLGHRRLSIIDLASGHQPLFNEDETIAVVFNGEIYNFKELTQELKQSGHQFHTHCDTEVIVHAWEEWGEACIDRFRGMFAFALWDRNRQTLFLARDRFGIKPLYYAELPNNELIFASELKALLVHPGLQLDIDHCALEEYFALGYVPDPRTIFSHVKKLSPGHSLTCKFGNKIPDERQYWDINFQPLSITDENTIQSELIERLSEAVDIRMVSEVPLGAFLSGGVDSGAIVALMANATTGDPINTCSIGFNTPEYNETEFAEMVADRYNTTHHVEKVEADDFELLDTLADLYDEPFADSSAIPTYRVCELAKRRVTVALSGDGGDEIFAGYRRYQRHMNGEKTRSLIPEFMRSSIFGPLGKHYPKLYSAPRIFRAKSTFQSLARNSMQAYMHLISSVHSDLRNDLYSTGFKSTLQGYTANEVIHKYVKQAPTDHPLSIIQYIDMKTYLPGDILTKVDRASMAHSLEVRVPLLDHKFVEWASGISPDLMLRGKEGKYVLKKSLEKYLPRDVLYRSKMGFAVPLESWFRGPLKKRVRESILGERLSDTGIFDTKHLGNLVDEHQSGKRDHSGAIWSLLMFDAFHRKVLS